MLFIVFSGDEQATKTAIIEADQGDTTLATYWGTAACLVQIYDTSGWTSDVHALVLAVLRC